MRIATVPGAVAENVTLPNVRNSKGSWGADALFQKSSSKREGLAGESLQTEEQDSYISVQVESQC